MLQLRLLVTGYWISQAIYVVAKLGVPDLLAAGEKKIETIATEAGVDGNTLYRVLRALSGQGLFFEEPERTFRLTSLGRWLTTDIPGSLRYYAIMMGEEQFAIHGHLLESVKTGKSSFAEIFGEPYFSYLQKHPESSRIFNLAMTSVGAEQNRAILDAYDFSGLKKLVDVGGGYGPLLGKILERNPSLHNVLYDLPEVMTQARATITAAPWGDRCEVQSGSFFDEVPSGADAYLLKYILHDWEDELALTILKNCRRAMVPGARLLVVEQVIPAGNEPVFAKFADLHMHVLLGGRERTEKEFRDLLGAAGFKVQKIVPTSYLLKILEARV